MNNQENNIEQLEETSSLSSIIGELQGKISGAIFHLKNYTPSTDTHPRMEIRVEESIEILKSAIAISNKKFNKIFSK